jgi:hypothetical protein
LLLTGLITTTLLAISLTIIVTTARLITATLLRSIRLQVCAEALGAESALAVTVVRSWRVCTLCMNTRTWRASLWSIIGIRRAITFTATFIVLLCRNSFVLVF